MPLLLKKTTKFMNEMFKFKENMSLISNEEIKKAINEIKKFHNKIIVLHCVSEYPTKLKDTNLNSYLLVRYL